MAVTLLAAGSALHGTAKHCRLKAVYKELAVRFNDKKERPKLFEDCRYTYTPPRLLMAKVGAGAPTGERGVWGAPTGERWGLVPPRASGGSGGI